MQQKHYITLLNPLPPTPPFGETDGEGSTNSLVWFGLVWFWENKNEIQVKTWLKDQFAEGTNFTSNSPKVTWSWMKCQSISTCFFWACWIWLVARCLILKLSQNNIRGWDNLTCNSINKDLGYKILADAIARTENYLSTVAMNDMNTGSTWFFEVRKQTSKYKRSKAWLEICLEGKGKRCAFAKGKTVHRFLTFYYHIYNSSDQNDD